MGEGIHSHKERMFLKCQLQPEAAGMLVDGKLSEGMVVVRFKKE